MFLQDNKNGKYHYNYMDSQYILNTLNPQKTDIGS